MINISDPLFLQYIKKPLIILVILLLMITGLSYYILDLKDDFDRTVHLKDRSLTKIINQVKYLRAQESLFIKYGSQYQGFLEAGLAHEVDRVKWTDQLLSIQKKLSLDDFNIQFEAEEKLTRKQVKRLKISKDIFYYSKLNILSDVHSDLDMLSIFNAIDVKITPLYLIDACELQGDPTRFNLSKLDKVHPLFNLQCSIILLQAKPNRFNLK